MRGVDLIRLDVTADDIANGVPLSWARCPVALALKRVSPPPPTVRWEVVETQATLLAEKGLLVQELIDAYDMPAEASRFIRAFDRRKKVKPITFDLRRRNTVRARS